MPHTRRKRVGIIVALGLGILDRIARLILVARGEQGSDYWLQSDSMANVVLSSQRELGVLLAGVALIAAIIWLLRSMNTSVVLGVGLMLVVVGGVNNFVDRLYYAGVVDYFQTSSWAWTMADAMIWVGVFAVIWHILRPSIQRESS